MTNEQQIAAMHLHFPNLRIKRRGIDSAIWEGKLRPTFEKLTCITTSTYFIRIMYRAYEFPAVQILNPILRKNTPHLNRDMTLCLHYLEDKSWGPEKLIAETIVPWTVEWLLCYEIWQITGKWYGPEAPH